MADDELPPRTWTYLYIERTDAGYTARIVESGSGREIRSFPIPTTRGALERALADDGQHPIDVIESFDAAERNYARGDNDDVRSWQDLQWRAKRGEATREDVARIVAELEVRRPDQIYYLHILKECRAVEYEPLVAARLDDWSDFNEPYLAIQTLVSWELLDKYESTLIAFMKGTPYDREHNWDLSSWCIAFAEEIVRERRRPRLLRAMIETAVQVPAHRRVNAISHLARVVGHDERTINESMAIEIAHGEIRDHPFAASVLESAEELLRELEGREAP